MILKQEGLAEFNDSLAHRNSRQSGNSRWGCLHVQQCVALSQTGESYFFFGGDGFMLV